MDSSYTSKNRPNEYLGVNKMGKNIKKSPLHQPNFISSEAVGNSNNNATRQQPQPQVYNISKSDFRSIVQQLTGSPLHSQETLPPRPPNNPPKHPSNRLQRIRPPPLTPINRPVIANVVPVPAPAPFPGPAPVPASIQPPILGLPRAVAPAQVPYNNNFARPPQFGPPSPVGMPPLAPDWLHPALSPVSAYIQQLESCMHDPGMRPSHSQPPLQPVPGQAPAPSQMQPGDAGQVQRQPPPYGLPQTPPGLPFPSPRMNGPAHLPSPNSQFLLPSPTLPSPSAFFNWLSPTARSPYPLLSPGSQFPPPLSPNFSFPPMSQPGLLGPGPQPPLSPGAFPLSPGAFPLSPGAFPLSPSFFFPVSSPRWRNA